MPAIDLANIRIIERETLVENADRVGAYPEDRITRLMNGHPFIGAVRGKGLLLAVEVVKDRATRTPFPEADGIADRLTAALTRNGVLARAGNVINVAPPLAITEAEADELTDIRDRALGETERDLAIG